jgi:hypothetical protein
MSTRRSVPQADASRPTPYNPLEKSELAKSVETALLARPRERLDQVAEFLGVGIYVIYYNGSHPIYVSLSAATPIYVGKAVPRGSRKGRTAPVGAGRELWERIDEHRESAEQAADLDPSHFDVRYLVADELFIPLAERLMIRTFGPVWNVVVDGFGNHDPGSGRYNQKLSPWDALHPGRPWAQRLGPPKIPPDAIVAEVQNYLAGRPALAAEVNLPPDVPLEPGDDHAFDDSDES